MTDDEQTGVTYFATEYGSMEPWGETYTSLDIASEDYEDGRRDDIELKVWAQHADGALIDVTDAAAVVVRQRYADRKQRLPEWLQSDDERDEAERDALLDQQHEAYERFGWEQV